MQREIETFAFHLGGDTQADDRVDDLQEDQRDNGVVHYHDDDAFDLVHHLRGVAFDQARGTAVFVDRKHAGEQCADDAADTVYTEAVERVVSAEHALEAGDAPRAEHACSDADHHRADRADVARGRSDGDEAGDRTRAHADDGGFAADGPFHQHPGEGRDRG